MTTFDPFCDAEYCIDFFFPLQLNAIFKYLYFIFKFSIKLRYQLTQSESMLTPMHTKKCPKGVLFATFETY